MPLNLLKIYNALLDLDALDEEQRIHSLMSIFRRDFVYRPNKFRQKIIFPTYKEGRQTLELEILFQHLVTTTERNGLHRVYDRDRAVRMHWIRHHLEERLPEVLSVFSVRDKKAIRTYLYDRHESFVIVLEPRGTDRYYFLTAYYLKGGNKNKIQKKMERKLPFIY